MREEVKASRPVVMPVATNVISKPTMAQTVQVHTARTRFLQIVVVQHAGTVVLYKGSVTVIMCHGVR